MESSSDKQQADYGVDAPGVVVTMFLVGFIALAIALGIRFTVHSPSRWVLIFQAISLGYGVVFASMGLYLLHWSRVGKIRGREALLDQIPWTGNEIVLDVGCGRGLMLLAAAKRVPHGRAVGIDIWQTKDQTGNRPAATLENAQREGVQDRISLETADMRYLPFADASFDVIVSHWAVHNLPTAQDRNRALSAMARVLKPGGHILLADIMFHHPYADHFHQLGLHDIRQIVNRPRDIALLVLTSGRFRSAVTLARKSPV